MSHKKTILISILSVTVILAAISSVALVSRPNSPPVITGVFIPDALELKEFNLIDHNNNAFTTSELQGQWHIVSYGFTFCPDICPTTLTTLAQVKRDLIEDQKFEDLQVLFYTIDPQRDTPERMSEYVKWFDKEFIGLTAAEIAGEPDLAFEKSLGIVSVLTPLEMDEGLEDVGGYSVSHGVAMYLLNPEGKLQAVLKPTEDRNGEQYFTVEQIYKDYTKVRKYVG